MPPLIASASTLQRHAFSWVMFVRHQLPPTRRCLAAPVATKASVQEMLARPSWSVRSLAEPDAELAAEEPITTARLHHLLRLAALPLPKSGDEERAMKTTLQDQLRFVRALQRVDTRGLAPLAAIRDETKEGLGEITFGLGHLKQALDTEVAVGHYRRPRRSREDIGSDQEKWPVLSTARRKAGKYFVVDSGAREGRDT